MSSQTSQRPSMRGPTLVYLLLCALTLFTWGVARFGLHGLGASLLVLGVALVKGRFIGDWFMALRGVSGFWRWAVTVWLLLIAALVGSAFMITNGG